MINIILMTALSGAFIASLVFAVLVKIFSSAEKTNNDWVLSNINDRMYAAFYGDKDPDEAAEMFRLDLERYYDSCLITNTEPQVKKLVMYATYGVFVMAACIIISLFLDPGIRWYANVVGFSVFVYLYYYQQHRLDKKAERRKEQLGDEIPRFVGLLYAELQIGMSIENAIAILCEKMDDSLLAEEFRNAFNEAEIGYRAWQDAMENIAYRYDIPVLNVFVQNVVTAFNEGVSIVKTVERMTHEINEKHLLGVKKRAGAATNTLLLPIALFQCVPMIVFLMYPALMQLSTSGFGL